MGSSMKVHQFARGLWEHEPSSLTLAGCKRLRPLAPKLATSDVTTTAATASIDLKSFIRPESGPRKIGCSHEKKETTQVVETHPGGTRWNPTQEQIGILETLYREGMRTPNAQEIEKITAELGKFGKIEGKNVFYWFQNHKARERQKQKRNSLGLGQSPRTPATTTIAGTIMLDTWGQAGREEVSPCKRKCLTWAFQCLEEEGDKTLELFPLHPEGR